MLVRHRRVQIKLYYSINTFFSTGTTFKYGQTSRGSRYLSVVPHLFPFGVQPPTIICFFSSKRAPLCSLPRSISSKRCDSPSRSALPTSLHWFPSSPDCGRRIHTRNAMHVLLSMSVGTANFSSSAGPSANYSLTCIEVMNAWSPLIEQGTQYVYAPM